MSTVEHLIDTDSVYLFSKYSLKDVPPAVTLKSTFCQAMYFSADPLLPITFSGTVHLCICNGTHSRLIIFPNCINRLVFVAENVTALRNEMQVECFIRCG